MDTVSMIQAVISTLEGLDIKSTYENMDRLLGCMQTLEKVKDALREVKTDAGADHAE